MTIRSGSRYASAFSNTALTTLKMAVFAPIPSASVSTATAVKPGFLSNWRKANFKSFIALHELHRYMSYIVTRLHWLVHGIGQSAGTLVALTPPFRFSDSTIQLM